MDIIQGTISQQRRHSNSPHKNWVVSHLLDLLQQLLDAHIVPQPEKNMFMINRIIWHGLATFGTDWIDFLSN